MWTSSELDSGPVVTAHTASASCAYVTSCPLLRIRAARIRNSMPVSPSCRPPLLARPDALQPASRGLNRPDCVTLLSQPGSNRPREATVVFHQGNFPLNGHADGILPWNLRRSRRLGVTAEIQGPFLNKVCEAR